MSHKFDAGFWIATWLPICKSGSFLACMLIVELLCLFLCLHSFFIWLLPFWGCLRAGDWSCTGCPNNFCAGESPSLLQEVFRYWSSARNCWFQLIPRPVQAADISFFIDLTVASALPLLCEYRGEEILCDTPNGWRNLLNEMMWTGVLHQTRP